MEIGARLDRALEQFDADAFSARHGGAKESRSPHSREWLLRCWCGSERLRWRHEPGVKQAWICWGCGRTGDTVQLVQWLERCSEADAIGYVLDGYVGGDAPTELQRKAVMPTPSKISLGVLPTIPFPRGFEWLDLNTPAHREAWRYLIQGRGLHPSDVARYRLGYSRHGRLKGYVIFPCFIDGSLVYWQGRATYDPPPGTPEERKAWIKSVGYRKTLNPSKYEGAAGASEILFNYDGARHHEHVVICEGPIDAIKVGPHAVALLGKVTTPAKVERLLRTAARRYTVYLDRGEEERMVARRLARELHAFVPTFLAEPPPGHDPGSLTREQNRAVVENAVPFRAMGLQSRLKIS